MSYRLFLDDYRQPRDCATYMHTRIGAENPIYLQEWTVVKSYDEFIAIITRHGLPSVVSFDHDLADEHYSMEYQQMPELYDTCQEKTGYHCAEWLLDYCRERNLIIPTIIVHSMNPVGTENILSLF